MFKIDVKFNVKILKCHTFSNIQFVTFVKNIAQTSRRENTVATFIGGKQPLNVHSKYILNRDYFSFIRLL